MKYFGKPKIVIIYICTLILIIISGCNVSDSISGKKELISETAITNQSNGGIRKDLNHNNLQLIDGETYQQGDDEFEINIQKVIDTAEQYNLSYSLKDINDDGLNEIIMVDVRDDVSFVVAIYAQINGSVESVFEDYNDFGSQLILTHNGIASRYVHIGTNCEFIISDVRVDEQFIISPYESYHVTLIEDNSMYNDYDEGLNFFYTKLENDSMQKNKMDEASWKNKVALLLSDDYDAVIPGWINGKYNE